MTNLRHQYPQVECLESRLPTGYLLLSGFPNLDLSLHDTNNLQTGLEDTHSRTKVRERGVYNIDVQAKEQLHDPSSALQAHEHLDSGRAARVSPPLAERMDDLAIPSSFPNSGSGMPVRETLFRRLDGDETEFLGGAFPNGSSGTRNHSIAGVGVLRSRPPIPSSFRAQPQISSFRANSPTRDACSNTLNLDIAAPPVVVRGAPGQWQFHTTDAGPPTGLIRDTIGTVHAVSQPIADPVDDIRDADAWNNDLHIVGEEESGDGPAAAQEFDLLTLTASPALVLHSLDWLNNPGIGNDGGFAFDVQMVGSDVLYYGGADSPDSTNTNSEGHIWDKNGNATGIGFLNSIFKLSLISSGATTGTHVGIDGNVAMVHFGSTGEYLDTGFSYAVDITDDASKIAGFIDNGAKVWKYVGPGPLDYQLSQLTWQIPPNSNNTPGHFGAIVAAPCFGDPAFGDFLDTSVFKLAAGAWNTNTGANEWRSVHSRVFADAQVVGSDVVVAINNSPGGGAELWGLRDSTGLRIKEDLLPNSPYISITIVPGGLFVHENTIGIVATGLPSGGGPGETFVATFNLLPPTSGGGPYTYDIDWNNDGNFDETQVGGDTISIKHVFAADGPATVRARVSDGTVTSSDALHPVTVLPWAVQTVGNRDDLIVGGTTGADTLTYQPNGGDYDVYLNGDLIASLAGIERVVFWGQAGNDSANLLGLPREAALYGGAGNDVLFSASGPTIHNGGKGADQLNALGSPRHLLLGGIGDDFLFSTGQNLGISGATIHDNDDAALYAALSHWAADRPLPQRIAHASATFSPSAVSNDFVSDLLVGRVETMYAVWHPGDPRRGLVEMLY